MRKIGYILLFVALILSVVRCAKGGKGAEYEPQPDDKEQFLRWATEKMELCRQQNDETEALRTEAEIGFVIAQLGEVEEGLAKLDSVIDALDEQRHFNEMDACIIAIKRKINVLDQIEKPGDIITLAQQIIKKTDHYREHHDEYADGSSYMPSNDKKIEEYCNLNLAQAYGFLSKAYADLGINKTARCYLELFEETDYGKTYEGRMMISDTWCKLGYFDKMLAVYDEATERLGSDTINIEYVKILYGMAMAADAAENYSDASNYWQRYAELKNLLDKKQRESQAYHYAVRYHLQEERIKTEHEQAKAHISMIMAISGFILVVVAIIFIVWLLIQRKAMNRKDPVLTEQISETVNKKINEKTVAVKSKPKTQKSKLDAADMDDKQLFEYLSDVIRREKLFLDPNFGRQVLVDRFHINERRIGAAFTITEGLPDFIRDLRLEYACNLFTEHPDMAVSDVAESSGFSNLTVFGRDFKRKYDVTPTYYRSQMASKIAK